MFTAILALTLAAPALKDPPKKPTDLTGEWVVESSTYNGRARPVTTVAQRYEFAADGTWNLYRGERKQAGNRAYRTDPSASTPAITLKYDAAEQDGPESLGIYRIEGDTLTLCYARPGDSTRPTKFESPNASGIYLIVFKRAKPKD